MKSIKVSSDHRRLLEVALKAVRAGERASIARFSDQRMKPAGYKKHREIVTAGDMAANAAIIRLLKRATPSIPICSEEGADMPAKNLAKADLAWVLDPIDGTSNFAIRLPLWGISLALVVAGEPVIGVISLPVLGQTYASVRGAGAWMGKRRITVSSVRRLRDAVAFMCYGYRNEERRRGTRIADAFSPRVQVARRLGAAVVEATWVASGRADLSILSGVHPWDVAAGALLVREAGGKVLTTKGRDWTINDPDIVFATPNIVPEAMRVLRSG